MAFQFRMASLRNEEDTLALLVWLFELPPSAITIDNWVVTVPPTIEAYHVYDQCNAMGTYTYWSEQLFGDRYGITLRKEPYPISAKGWDFKKESGYRSKFQNRGYIEYRHKFNTTKYHPADIEWLINFNRGYGKP